MNAKVIYKEYDKKVQEYMCNVIKCLEADYGKIPESWRVSLDLIADNYDLYLRAKDDIKKNGLLREDNLHRTFKNQSISIMNNAQSQLKDLLKSFALTPLSKSKMKQLDKDDMDDYLDELMN